MNQQDKEGGLLMGKGVIYGQKSPRKEERLAFKGRETVIFQGLVSVCHPVDEQ